MDEFFEENEFINMAKKENVLCITIVDTSASNRKNEKQMNEALKYQTDLMKQLDQSHHIAKIKYAMMNFDQSAKWMIEKPVDISNYSFMEVNCSNHPETRYGPVYQELNRVLQENEFLEGAMDYYPIIILLTDGAPSDGYNQFLEAAENNKYFANARRFAIYLGDENMNEFQYRNSLEYSEIANFTKGKEENIFLVKQLDQLKDILEIVTIASVKRKREEDAIDQFNLEDPFNDIRRLIYENN